jgi:putative transposase
MNSTTFSEQQIAVVLRKVDQGATVAEVCKMAGISASTYRGWRKMHGKAPHPESERMKQLEEENRALKALVAELTLTKRLLQESLRSRA